MRKPPRHSPPILAPRRGGRRPVPGRTAEERKAATVTVAPADPIVRAATWLPLAEEGPALSAVAGAGAGAGAPRAQADIFMPPRLSRIADEALSALGKAPIIELLTGPRGVGKSQLLRRLESTLRERRRTVIPQYRPGSVPTALFSAISTAMALPPPGSDVGAWLRAFHEALAAGDPARPPILLIDDAELLGDAVLTAIGWLIAPARERGAALGVVLVGRPELSSRLDDAEFRRLRGCLKHIVLEPFAAEEVAEFARHQSRHLAQRDDLFSEAAVEAVIRLAEGLPASVRFLCSRGARLAREDGRRVVGAPHIERAARMLRPNLREPTPLSPSAPLQGRPSGGRVSVTPQPRALRRLRLRMLAEARAMRHAARSAVAMAGRAMRLALDLLLAPPRLAWRLIQAGLAAASQLALSAWRLCCGALGRAAARIAAVPDRFRRGCAAGQRSAVALGARMSDTAVRLAGGIDWAGACSLTAPNARRALAGASAALALLVAMTVPADGPVPAGQPSASVAATSAATSLAGEAGASAVADAAATRSRDRLASQAEAEWDEAVRSEGRWLEAEQAAAGSAEAAIEARNWQAAARVEATQLAAIGGAAQRAERERTERLWDAGQRIEEARLAAEDAAVGRAERALADARWDAGQQIEVARLAAEDAAAGGAERALADARWDRGQQIEVAWLAAEDAAAGRAEQANAEARWDAGQRVEALRVAAEDIAAERSAVVQANRSWDAGQRTEQSVLAAEDGAVARAERARMLAAWDAARRVEGARLVAEDAAASRAAEATGAAMPEAAGRDVARMAVTETAVPAQIGQGVERRAVTGEPSSPIAAPEAKVAEAEKPRPPRHSSRPRPADPAAPLAKPSEPSRGRASTSAVPSPQLPAGVAAPHPPLAPEPSVAVAAVGSASKPECRPYRGATDYAGRLVVVVGSACRDLAGQWWLMDQHTE